MIWQPNIVILTYNLFIDGYSYEDILDYLDITDEGHKLNFKELDEIIDLGIKAAQV